MQLSSLAPLVRPLIRLCLEYGFTLNDLVEVSKFVFVEEGRTIVKKRGKSINLSRVALLTGVHRADVRRLLNEAPNLDDSRSAVSRVLTQWENDKRFLDGRGKPRVLSFKGEESEFAELVSVAAKSYRSGTVLAELVRTKLVEKTEAGLKMLETAEDHSQDANKGYELIGSDIERLIQAGSQNLENRGSPANLHAQTHFDNILCSKIPEVRKWLLEEGMALHRRARAFLAQLDKDINPSGPDDPGGGVVTLTTFSVTEPTEFSGEMESQVRK